MAARPRSSMARDALVGALLAIGPAAGWLLYRTWDRADGLRGAGVELSESWVLYAYLLVGSVLVFATFGAVLGHLIDRLREANASLKQEAITDALTGLRNPRYFHERLAQECARADRDDLPLGLIVIDLDHFKSVNDRLGHAFGDLALSQAANLFASCARSSDVVCRIGGEEFAVICPGTIQEEALAVAERMRRTLELTCVQGHDGTAQLTASFGVAVRWPGTPPVAIYQAADRALYVAKERGRNRVEPVRPALVREVTA